MVFQWLKKIGTQHIVDVAAIQKAAEMSERHKRQEENVVDVPHHVLTNEDAQRQKETLRYLVQVGSPLMRREQLKEKVRGKVGRVMQESFAFNDASMVEEITERIVDAAEIDPHYAKMFEA